MNSIGTAGLAADWSDNRFEQPPGTRPIANHSQIRAPDSGCILQTIRCSALHPVGCLKEKPMVDHDRHSDAL